MYGPRVRFMLAVTLLSVLFWAYIVGTGYLFGPHGLNFSRYISGALTIGAATLGGFFLVWVSVRFLNFQENHRTGFEAVEVDDTGTIFNIKLSLTKFLPEIIASPAAGVSEDDLPPLSALEAELIGFLNSLGEWPYDLARKDYTLREHALQQWQAMRSLPNTTPIHRVAALAQDLGKVYAYAEVRKSAPFSYFWKRDQVSYIFRSHEHGGMAALILSNMPSFRNTAAHEDLGRNSAERRALLTAIRYCKEPHKLPSNCDPLAREIYEMLNKASLKAREMAGENIQLTEPLESDLAALQQDIELHLPSALKALRLAPEESASQQDGFVLDAQTIAVQLPRLVDALLPLFSPQVRTAFQLWDTASATAHIEPYLIQALQENKLAVDVWEDTPAHNGTFTFNVGKHTLPHCVVLHLHTAPFQDFLATLAKLPPLTEMVDLVANPETQLHILKEKAQKTDLQLAGLFPRMS